MSGRPLVSVYSDTGHVVDSRQSDMRRIDNRSLAKELLSMIKNLEDEASGIQDDEKSAMFFRMLEAMGFNQEGAKNISEAVLKNPDRIVDDMVEQEDQVLIIIDLADSISGRALVPAPVPLRGIAQLGVNDQARFNANTGPTLPNIALPNQNRNNPIIKNNREFCSQYKGDRRHRENSNQNHKRYRAH